MPNSATAPSDGTVMPHSGGAFTGPTRMPTVSSVVEPFESVTAKVRECSPSDKNVSARCVPSPIVSGARSSTPSMLLVQAVSRSLFGSSVSVAMASSTIASSAKYVPSEEGRSTSASGGVLMGGEPVSSVMPSASEASTTVSTGLDSEVRQANVNGNNNGSIIGRMEPSGRGRLPQQSLLIQAKTGVFSNSKKAAPRVVFLMSPKSKPATGKPHAERLQASHPASRRRSRLDDHPSPTYNPASRTRKQNEPCKTPTQPD